MCFLLIAAFFSGAGLFAQIQFSPAPISYGYNGVFLAGGEGLIKPIGDGQTKLPIDSPWSMYCWVWMQEPVHGPTLVAGMGDPMDEYSRYFVVSDSNLFLRGGQGNRVEAPVRLTEKSWHLLAATFDGVTTRLYSDGKEAASGNLAFGSISPIVEMAPTVYPWETQIHFAGKIASFIWMQTALTPSEIAELYKHPVDFSTVHFEDGSESWPVQTQAQRGMAAPQNPTTMPRSKAPFSKPVVGPLPALKATLQPISNHEWTITGGWRLTEAGKVNAAGPEVAKVGYETNGWLPATVPGTVLTTMINRGIYPDPNFGLNDLAIPESLNKQDYWYRVEFPSPRSIQGQHLTLTFNGINYGAAVWLNGHRLGSIRGAFIRGVFDVTGMLSPGGMNALAVRISPPPHPGIPHEQSLTAGRGPNGGILCLDGPTFVATEGWDWIPAIRDRDTGIWQDVTLTATGQVKIGDSQVITKLPLPDIDSAKVYVNVPLKNLSDQTVEGKLTASFGQTFVTKNVSLPPGKTIVKLTPAEFHQLTVVHPRLWWPNGYGKPELYRLKLTFDGNSGESDAKQLNFGIREVTYELSLLDSTGHLRRVEVSPTEAMLLGQQVVDVTHEGTRAIPRNSSDPAAREKWIASLTTRPELETIRPSPIKTWVASLLPGAENSPAVHAIEDTRAAPYLVIKVNGVRIAARGGNWGVDDMLKHVSQDHLEPYFRLERNANVNIIRNWVGQNSEETLYDLADKYGLMIWNDFWESTQNYNLEAGDPALFLANARDTVLRFRNHPSIVMWCGRNEGVPQPALNQGMVALLNSLDGTRYYSPSSNRVNLQDSGPYVYQNPALYYTTLNRGFSMETGTASIPTLETFRSMMAPADQWPISDVWAYHDWHRRDSAAFLKAMDAEFGAATSLEDFVRKAQMLNYVAHRAIFEGFSAHLWAPNSARLIWMTQSAWPSLMYQIVTHDYDTNASFYATKKACEPIHVQLDLSNYQVDVVNMTLNALSSLSVTEQVYSLQNKLLLQQQQQISVQEDDVSHGVKLDLAPLLSSGMVFVKLELKNSSGALLSDNFYWLGADEPAYRQLNQLPVVTLTASATSKRNGDGNHLTVQLRNPAATAALAIKLTLENVSDGSRILPAYLSDNYFSLLPGEARTIEIQYPEDAAKSAPKLEVRGWNISPLLVSVSGGR